MIVAIIIIIIIISIVATLLFFRSASPTVTPIATSSTSSRVLPKSSLQEVHIHIRSISIPLGEHQQAPVAATPASLSYSDEPDTELSQADQPTLPSLAPKATRSPSLRLRVKLWESRIAARTVTLNANTNKNNNIMSPEGDIEAAGESTPLLQPNSSGAGNNELPPPLQEMKVEALKERAVAITAAVSTVTSILAVMLESALHPVVWISGILGAILAPYAAIQQQKLTQVEALNQTNARMEQQVEQLTEENIRLLNQVKAMEESVIK
jgi:hypothetical protein